MHNEQEVSEETANGIGATEQGKLGAITDGGCELCDQVSDAGVNAADNARPKRRLAEAIIESRKRVAAGEKIIAVMRDMVVEFPDNALGIAVAIAPLHAYGQGKNFKTATDYAMCLLSHVNQSDERRLKKRDAERARRARFKALVQSGDEEAIAIYERRKRMHAEIVRRRKAITKQAEPPESHDGAQR